MFYPSRLKKITVDQSKVLKIDCSDILGPPGIGLQMCFDVFMYMRDFSRFVHFFVQIMQILFRYVI